MIWCVAIIAAMGLLLLSAAPAHACKYSSLADGVGRTLTAAEREEIAKDEKAVWKLRAELSAICRESNDVPINSCQRNLGLCSALSAEQRTAFAYPSPEGVRYKVSEQQRRKMSKKIDAYYKKWSSR